jgi:hypothetical protein
VAAMCGGRAPTRPHGRLHWTRAPAGAQIRLYRRDGADGRRLASLKARAASTTVAGGKSGSPVIAHRVERPAGQVERLARRERGLANQTCDCIGLAAMSGPRGAFRRLAGSPAVRMTSKAIALQESKQKEKRSPNNPISARSRPPIDLRPSRWPRPTRRQGCFPTR